MFVETTKEKFYKIINTTKYKMIKHDNGAIGYYEEEKYPPVAVGWIIPNGDLLKPVIYSVKA